MSETSETLAFFTRGWQNYQNQLSRALARLEPSQLALRAAPGLRSIDELARHIIGVRVGWFPYNPEEGGEDFAPFGKGAAPSSPPPSPADTVNAFANTLPLIPLLSTLYTLA